jgi:menin
MQNQKIDKLFPLKSIENVINLFKHELCEENQPDLVLLSIVVGYIECSLTKSANIQQQTATQNTFPVIDWETVNSLYKKFKTIISIAETHITNNNNNSICQKKSRNATTTNTTDAPKYASREIIKRVSDIIWNSLQRSSYKDRAHLQSLYSYLVTNKLDCFGVAFAVVAGCQQVLGYNDVHLAISEDHVWVVFGKTGKSIKFILEISIVQVIKKN